MCTIGNLNSGGLPPTVFFGSLSCPFSCGNAAQMGSISYTTGGSSNRVTATCGGQSGSCAVGVIPSVCAGQTPFGRLTSGAGRCTVTGTGPSGRGILTGGACSA